MKGKQKRVKVYQGGKLIKTYETIISASNAHFPDKYTEYLNDKFKRTNGVFSKGELIFVKTIETGISQNYRRYFVKDKHADKTFTVIGTNEVLKFILNGHNNFFRQFKTYGNYDDTRFTIWRIN